MLRRALKRMLNHPLMLALAIMNGGLAGLNVQRHQWELVIFEATVALFLLFVANQE